MRFKFSPSPQRSSAAPDLLPALKQEFAAESAASLGATYQELAKALAKARALDTAPSASGPEREATLDAAAEALWRYVVQREACGFRNTEQVLRELQVPAAVRLRMGIRRG